MPNELDELPSRTPAENLPENRNDASPDFHTEVESPNSRRIEIPGAPPLKLTFISPTAFRLESIEKDNTSNLPELMIVKPDTERSVINLTVSKNEKSMMVSSSELNVAVLAVDANTVNITVTNAAGEKVINNWQLSPKEKTSSISLAANEHIYGFGDKRLAIDQRGNTLEMLNKDALLSQNNDSYKSVPFFRSSQGYGLFFHTFRPATFDVGETKSDELKINGKGGKLDFYVFANSDPKQIISEYTELTGRPAMLPRWAFGYHQGKASYRTVLPSRSETLDVAKTMRAKQLPFDNIFVDDFNDNLNNKEFIDHLKDKYDARITIGGNPFFIGDSSCRIAMGKDNQLLNDKNKKPVFEHETELEGDDGPGPKASYVDFFNPAAAKRFMDCTLKESLQKGTELGMADFGEMDNLKNSNAKFWPSLGYGISAEETRNLFALAYAKGLMTGAQDITAGRSAGMIRPGTAGTQRFGWSTTGDSEPSWDSFKAHLRALVNLSNSGFSNIGYDIGGWYSKGSDTVYARWFAAGTFNPFMWAHGQGDHEPYSHGAEVEKIAKSYLDLRYRMLPYLYSLQDNTHQTGVPIMRSMSLENPADDKSAKVGDQFYLGDGLLVAPVMDERGRSVYLPKGNWYDFFATERKTVESGTINLADIPLGKIPVYVKAGSIIPMGPNIKHSADKTAEPLTVHYYSHPESELASAAQISEFKLYNDDGASRKFESGAYERTTFSFEQSKTNIRFRASKENGNGTFVEAPRDQFIYIHGSQASQVHLNGAQIDQDNSAAEAGSDSSQAPSLLNASRPFWKHDGKGGTLIFLPKNSSGELDISTGY